MKRHRRSIYHTYFLMQVIIQRAEIDPFKDKHQTIHTVSSACSHQQEDIRMSEMTAKEKREYRLCRKADHD